MKKLLFKGMFMAALALPAMQFVSCKNKKSTTDNTSTTTGTDTSTMTTAPSPNPAPVEVSTDDALNTSVKDATKDFPGVNVAVNNGELTLTGDITREKLPKLMMALNSLHPKKINNNLTIK
jgi:outer membrane receptor for ferrienterochelin and colicin